MRWPTRARAELDPALWTAAVAYSLGEQTLELVDADLRPGLEIFAPLLQFGFGQEREVGDHRFAFLHLRFLESENVHDAEMDPADFGRVVVQERDDPILERRRISTSSFTSRSTPAR